jgi:hypothetical protein
LFEGNGGQAAPRRPAIKLTRATVAGNINTEWVSCVGAGTSLFGGKVITPRGTCMCIETKSLS